MGPGSELPQVIWPSESKNTFSGVPGLTSKLGLLSFSRRCGDVSSPFENNPIQSGQGFFAL